MAKLHNPPDPQRDEKTTADIFDRRGLKSDVATLLGFTRQNLDYEIAPPTGKPNFYHRFKRRLWAVDMVDEQAGDEWLTDLLCDRERWKLSTKPSREISEIKDEATGKLLDLVKGLRPNTPHEGRIERIRDAIEILQDLERAEMLIDCENGMHESSL
jgi:hypothetical protein